MSDRSRIESALWIGAKSPDFKLDGSQGRAVMLSDPTGHVSQNYGMYGAEDEAIQPEIVLLDPKGIVRMAVLGPTLHPDEVLQLVKHAVTGA